MSEYEARIHYRETTVDIGPPFEITLWRDGEQVDGFQRSFQLARTMRAARRKARRAVRKGPGRPTFGEVGGTVFVRSVTADDAAAE